MTVESKLLFVGYAFIILTGIINIVILITIFKKAVNNSDNRKRLLKTCGIMLLNIPIMILYCWVTMTLIGTMRITFINQTGTEITDVNIVGCSGGYIDKLEIGESETVWVSITGDCSIYVEYQSNGQRKKESVVGYVTPGMGQKMKHKIDGLDKDIL